MIGRVTYRVRGRLRQVRKAPEWAVGRIETVTGEDRGTLAALFSGLAVGMIAAVLAAFVVYRTVNSVPPVRVPGKTEGPDGSTGGQERETES